MNNLSKLDLIAMSALQGIMANKKFLEELKYNEKDIAASAYSQARAMIEESNNQNIFFSETVKIELGMQLPENEVLAYSSKWEMFKIGRIFWNNHRVECMGDGNTHLLDVDYFQELKTPKN